MYARVICLLCGNAARAIIDEPLWCAVQSKLAESRLIQELKPVLNTKEMDAGYFSGEPA